MIDFEEELSKFKPSPDISDMNDILMELLKEQIKG